MVNIIAIANQKGGVGKTTTTVNLAESLAVTRRVLLVDLDPQGNATMGSSVDKNALGATSNELLLNEVTIEEAIIRPEQIKYHVIGANSNLTAAEVGLINEAGREQRLQQALNTVKERYDFIFIDCPPALNMLTINAMVAADSVLVPMQCEYYALEGLSGLLETIEQLRSTVNSRLHLEGILRTMFDGRSRLAMEVSEQLLQHFGDKVYNTVIPRNIRLAEAPSHGLPILAYDKRSTGAQAYLALAGEVLRRHGLPLMQHHTTMNEEIEL